MPDASNPRAFPSVAIDDKCGGMTMLDWFAGQALAGILANSENAVAGSEPTNAALSLRPTEFSAWLAVTAFNVADAMLAERERRRG